MHDYLIAIILGLIEGICEFLPISSTGHLILTQHLLNFKDSGALFTVVIQLGAAFAVMWYARRDLTAQTIGLFRRQAEAISFWKVIAFGTIPAGIAGLLLDNYMDAVTVPAVVAIALIIGGIILWLVDRKLVHRGSHDDPIMFDQITPRRALLIGLGQCIAIVPGVSRSGATIVSGLLTGLNRPTATAFSFYLSVPVLILASGYKIIKYGDTVHTIPGGLTSLLIGLAVSFVTALVAISWLLKYIAHHDFRPFAYYRIILGTLILILLATGVMS